jgi:hypothetical protein
MYGAIRSRMSPSRGMSEGPEIFRKMGHMKKTTIWLAPEDATAVEEIARAEGRTQSDVIREGISRVRAERSPLSEWEAKPPFALQPIWFELFTDRQAGIRASETSRRLGMSPERLAEVAAIIERRFAPLPPEPTSDPT